MNISFISNFMNHHQLPFCTELLNLCDGTFTFWATMPLPEEQANLGYQNLNDLSFVTKLYNSDENYEKCRKAVARDDFVIFGACPDEFIRIRKKAGKPYAVYSERLFKKSRLRRFYLPTRKKILKHFENHEENACVLAASAYLAYDLSLMKLYPTVYKWGYFPGVKEHPDIDGVIADKEQNSILWVARFIKLKHPEAPLKVAEQLKNDGIRFDLKMIGIGPEVETVKRLIEEKGLSDCVHLLGSMSPSEVRHYMEKSEIFLFTSDKNEGWGAVLNESMNSACAVVASHAIGSVPFLIEDNTNGLIYTDGNSDELYKKVKFLLENPIERRRVSENAYHTMTELWDAKVAAKRLYNIIEARVNHKNLPIYETGPCSIAGVLPEKWR